MRRFVWSCLTAAFVLAVASLLFVFWPLRDRHPQPTVRPGVLAVRGATVYVSPDLPPLRDATLLSRDGRIVAVGQNVNVPPEAEILPCSGCVIAAGFWNVHVHFTEPKWAGAVWQPAGKLQEQLIDMLTSRGFTTVVDTGSDLRVTVSLRRRIERGELRGPKIYTAGSPIYPAHGIPFYVRRTMPRPLLALMASPETPSAAARDAERDLLAGADLLKLFTGSYVEHDRVTPMEPAIARAAVEVAHRSHKLVFAHPSDLQGVKVALGSGVDVLAHAPDTVDGIDDNLIALMAARAAMAPTLKMFATTVTTSPRYLEPIYGIVRRFHADGGVLLFGTDVGYMQDYSTVDEFFALARSGLNYREILRMLTAAPSQRFGVFAEEGTLEPGKRADFTLLGSDPATDVRAFADVDATVRDGRVLWQRTHD